MAGVVISFSRDSREGLSRASELRVRSRFGPCDSVIRLISDSLDVHLHFARGGGSEFPQRRGRGAGSAPATRSRSRQRRGRGGARQGQGAAFSRAFTL